MSDLRELYQEVIIDHSRSPRNYGVLEQANHHADGFNPLCGDKLTIYLKIENDLIQEVGFQGAGCAISMASASLLTEFLKGKNIQQAEEYFHQFQKMVTEDNGSDTKNLGKLTVLAGVKEFPARVKCATLAWHTFHAALENKDEIATTE